MKAWGCLVCLASAALLLAVPNPAAAKPGSEVRPKSLELELRTEASNGYAATVETVGHKQVILTVEGHGGSASYQVTGHVSRHGIEADFGAFGHISVRFKGAPKPNVLLPGLHLPPGAFGEDCKGRKPVREVGAFRGSIEFEGEHGFTVVDARKARGKVQRSYRQVCREGSQPFSAEASARPGLPKRPTVRLVELLAGQVAPTRQTFLVAIDFEAKDGLLKELLSGFLPIVGAIAMERDGPVRIVRKAATFGNPGAFLFSPPVKHPPAATLAPAKPFAGTAKLTRQAGSPPILVGPLAVRLPGGGLVPLSGPGFGARFCRSDIEDEKKACVRRAAAELGIPEEDEGSASASVQGSGSHSQAFAEARLSWSR